MTGVNAAGASAAAAAAAAPPSSSASSSWPKRLHKRCLKALTKSSATNVDMTLFRYLYEAPKGEEEKEVPPGDRKGDGAEAQSRDNNNNKKHDDKTVLCALAPLRAATLVLPWQRRLARRVIEHPKVGAPGVVNFVVARQRWFDARVGAFAGVEQVVALAAGYELRAHRCSASANNSKAAVTFFEADLPHASAKKQELVKKLGLTDEHVRYVPCDLIVPGQLRQKLEAAGFDATKATLFTAEGLIYYLPGAAVAALVREVGEIIKDSSQSSSCLALDYLHLDALEAGFAAGIGGAGAGLAGAAVGAGDGDGGRKKTKKDKKKKQKKAAKAAHKNNTNKMPRAYEVTARSVAAKGEPFLSGFGASPLEAASFVASASAGALSLRAHTTTRAACDELLGPKAAEEHGVLGFYSFLVAEAAGPLPPSAPGGVAVGVGAAGVGAAVAASDAVARVAA